MYINITETKRFVKEHKTGVACTATAIVAYKLGYRRALKGAIEGVTDVAYQWGARAGISELLVGMLREFIVENDMEQEFMEFIKTTAKNSR